MTGFMRRFVSTANGSIALAIFAAIVILAIFAPWIANQNPYDQAQLDIMSSRLPPGSEAFDGSYTFWFGTDDQGRDIFSCLLYTSDAADE